MLRIRQEQMEILYDAGVSRWILEYLLSSYPDRAQRLGKATVVTLSETVLKSARAHGFKEPEEIRKYAHLVFLFGPNFSTELTWAAEIMRDRHYKSGLARLRAVEDAALTHLKEKQTDSPQSGRKQLNA
jgi:hypothetical protein